MKIEEITFVIDNKEIKIDMTLDVKEELKRICLYNPEIEKIEYNEDIKGLHYEVRYNKISISTNEEKEVKFLYIDIDDLDDIDMRIKIDNQYIKMSGFIKLVYTLVDKWNAGVYKERFEYDYDNYKFKYAHMDRGNIKYYLISFVKL